MTYPVSTLTIPVLDLAFIQGVKQAEYVKPGGAVGAPLNALHFRYNVTDGDMAQPLDYTSAFALSGDIRRWTIYKPSLPANLTLANPSAVGSLAYCCNIQIDSSRPYVDSLIPLKRAGYILY